MSFPSINPALARALAAREYSVPTAVQLAVLDADGQGRDLLVSAQTGSGKTVAFGLAMAPVLLGQGEQFELAAEPLALIIAPTRELAMQVQRELAWLYADAGGRVVTCVGGMDARSEARQLEHGAHIVVGTPGRLRDHLERHRLKLSKLKSVVLDEADEMLDLGFREDLEFILDATPATRQTLLFSATMPRAIETLAQRYQRDAQRIETARRGEQHADIEYQAIRVATGDTENAVVNILRFHESRAALVFCATREAVKRMHARLVERGFSAVALSGELSQAERTQALQALRDGRARALVATDVAARGLDLPDLALVIHAELPNDRETLLHRSGRTGRAGKKGLCVLLVPYNRRRKAEALIAIAKLNIEWATAPTAEAILARDQERFLSDPMFDETTSEQDLEFARKLQAARTADEIAMALARLHRSRLPAPAELTDHRGSPRREDRPRGRDDAVSSEPREPRERRPRPERSSPAQEAGEAPQYTPRPPRAPRQDNREMVWFRLNIGRNRNAEPRWLLPLICKSGGVTKTEVGAITVMERETRFQIVAEIADQFAEAARTNTEKQGHISRVAAHTDADDQAVLAAIDQVATPAPARVAETTAPVEPAASRERAPRTKPRWRDRKPPEGREPRSESGRDQPNQERREAGGFRTFAPHKGPPKPWHKGKKKKPASGAPTAS